MFFDVFVVEDSKPILRNIIRQLKEIDNRIRIVGTAYNGEEALDKLHSLHADILITDIKMPKMDGLELIKRIKEKNQLVKFLIISGYDEFEYARQAMKLQVNDYILKPVDYQELKKIIKNIIGQIEISRRMHIENILELLIKNKSQKIESIDTGIISFNFFVVAVIRYSLSKKNSIKIDKSYINDFIRQHKFKDMIWLIDTGFSSEIVLFINTDNLINIEISNFISEFHNYLCDKYKQINVIVSKPQNDILRLCSCYNYISNLLSTQIKVGQSNIYYENTVVDNYSMKNLNAEALLIEKNLI